MNMGGASGASRTRSAMNGRSAHRSASGHRVDRPFPPVTTALGEKGRSAGLAPLARSDVRAAGSCGLEDREDVAVGIAEPGDTEGAHVGDSVGARLLRTVGEAHQLDSPLA